MELPLCPRCRVSKLIPLSDWGLEGATITFKTWTCVDLKCQFMIKSVKGEPVYYNLGPRPNGR